jgi:hypothetical protein
MRGFGTPQFVRTSSKDHRPTGTPTKKRAWHTLGPHSHWLEVGFYLASCNQPEPTTEYLTCIGREEELDRLRNQVRTRKSLLVFGPEGVGKSRLLRSFVGNYPMAAYVPQMRSPREFVLSLLQALHIAEEGVAVPASPAALSTSSLKGIVHRALDKQPFLMVLDHLDAPSRVVTGMIKDLHYYARTPGFLHRVHRKWRTLVPGKSSTRRASVYISSPLGPRAGCSQE